MTRKKFVTRREGKRTTSYTTEDANLPILLHLPEGDRAIDERKGDKGGGGGNRGKIMPVPKPLTSTSLKWEGEGMNRSPPGSGFESKKEGGKAERKKS